MAAVAHVKRCRTCSVLVLVQRGGIVVCQEADSLLHSGSRIQPVQHLRAQERKVERSAPPGGTMQPSLDRHAENDLSLVRPRYEACPRFRRRPHHAHTDRDTPCTHWHHSQALPSKYRPPSELICPCRLDGSALGPRWLRPPVHLLSAAIRLQ